MLLRTQAFLPLNPQGFGNLAPDLAWNTAISFMTNTNWQFYSGESTMSYLSQMAGLGWHMFVSAGTGDRDRDRADARLVAPQRSDDRQLLGRPDARACSTCCCRSRSWARCVLVWQGVPQNFAATPRRRRSRARRSRSRRARWRRMEIIKELGTNGGGFVNANSASPWENPTGLTNLLELVCIFLIGGALTYTFGRYVKDQRQGWALFAAMTVLFVVRLHGGVLRPKRRATRSCTRSASPAATWRARRRASASPRRRCSRR